MMKFDDLKLLIETVLPSEWDDKKVWYEPGPDMPDQPVDYIVNLSIDGGDGLRLEGVLDNISWQVKVSSAQSLYATGEQLAWDVDRGLLNWIPGRVPDPSNLLISSIYRVGGAPSHFEIDDAERTQFVCSYFFDVESGLQYI